MGRVEIAERMGHLRGVFQRRAGAVRHDDPPASAYWAGGLRIEKGHSSGGQVVTDMSAELGGSSGQMTPLWLFRAGVASCAATSIALVAAARGIDLTPLEFDTGSGSDSRGLPEAADVEGRAVYVGPKPCG